MALRLYIQESSLRSVLCRAGLTLINSCLSGEGRKPASEKECFKKLNLNNAAWWFFCDIRTLSPKERRKAQTEKVPQLGLRGKPHKIVLALL